MRYVFDGFTLDVARVELTNGTGPVAIEPQVFELLALLVASRDRVVTRDEILERVWRGRIVSDTAISSRVKAARRAIGDDGAAQRLIRTIHGRGFRFVAEVVEETGRAGGPAPLPALAREAEAGAGGAAPDADALAAEVMARPAIAVLPFADTGAEGGASYLADGVTDEVIAALCAFRSFPVISRNTSFRYRASALPTVEIGRETGARYLLSGTLQRGREQVKLKAALIDAEADRQIWAGRVVRPADEMFALEEEIAERVVAMLEPEMRGAEMRRVLRKPAQDMTAWDLAMRAMACLNRPAAAPLADAVTLAEAAARRAPDWYLPFALVAQARFQQAMRTFSAADARTAFAETLEAARRALEIDATSWLAHALTAVGTLWTHRAHDVAMHHVDRAIELNPSACQNYHFGGCISGFSGLLPRARAHQTRIFRVDPAYPYTAVIEADLGLWHMLEGDLDAAERHLARALDWDAEYGRGLQRLVALSGLRGDRRRARLAMERLAAIGNPLRRDQIATSYPFRDPDHRERLFEGFRRAGLNL